MKILITAATSAQAQQLKAQLNNQTVLLGDHLALPTFMLVNGKMLRLPNPDEPAYPHKMLALCLDNEIDCIYLLRDEEATLLNEAKLLFEEYGIELIKAV